MVKVNFTTRISPCPFEMLALDWQRGNMMQNLAVTIFFLLHFFQTTYFKPIIFLKEFAVAGPKPA
jgi:hypothetical protein